MGKNDNANKSAKVKIPHHSPVASKDDKRKRNKQVDKPTEYVVKTRLSANRVKLGVESIEMPEPIVEEVIEETPEVIAEEAIEEVVEEVAEEVIEEPVEEVIEEPVEEVVEEAVEETPEEIPEEPETEEEPPEQPPKKLSKTAQQFLLATLFATMGVVLLMVTYLGYYQPQSVENSNRVLTNKDLRSDVGKMIREVFSTTISVDDELDEIMMRVLDKKKQSLISDSAKVVGEIDTLRSDNEIIMDLLVKNAYGDSNFSDISKDDAMTAECLEKLSAAEFSVNAQIEALGVAALKEEIAKYKGTQTTVTKENENGETITETVTEGGLIPELQAKKDELQKKYDEVVAKQDALDKYLGEISPKVSVMYNRLETGGKTTNVKQMLQPITDYVKAHPEDNIFLQDTAKKLASFPGESREEDDILFLMKIEAETGFRFPTMNYGQDYQLTKLSNGMLLCYEVYAIPYATTYQGLKNLFTYLTENDEFYASVYNLTIQYNPANQIIQGNILLMHYYLLSEDAEYVPPVLDENIQVGPDGIFGSQTGSTKPTGPVSNVTPEQIEEWLDSGMSLVDVRKKLSEEYLCPETELLWIMKKKYKTKDDIKRFLETYGDPDIDYDDQWATLQYLNSIFPNTDPTTLYEIYITELPDTDVPGAETPDDETTPAGKQSNYTVEDVDGWLAQGKSFEDIRDILVADQYPATELLWILKETYKTPQDVLTYLELNAPGKYQDAEDLTTLFGCSEQELEKILKS